MAAFRTLDMDALREIAGSSTLDFDLRRWTDTRRIVAEALPALVEAAERADLLDEAQHANASLVRLLAKRDETIAELKAEVDRQTALVLAGLKRMEKAVENSLRSLNS